MAHLESKIFEDDGNGTCVSPADGVKTGTLENVGDGNYSTIVDSETRTTKISFSGNTFSIEYSDTFDGQTTEYRDVYTRN